MTTPRPPRAAACLLALALLMAFVPVGAAAGATHWSVRYSEGFDALCALNLLSGDPYYQQEYAGEAAELATPRYAAARAEAAKLKTVLKDQNGAIVSAFLTLIFSGAPDSTLDAVLRPDVQWGSQSVAPARGRSHRRPGPWE